MTDETHVSGDFVQGDKVGGDKVAGDKHVHNYGDTPTYEAPPLPPHGTLPDTGHLPPGSRPVYGRYPQFTGREKELLNLANVLLYDNGPNTAVIAQPAIASGMGGIGKTQLAIEFMYRYGRFFPGGVYWISFSDPAAIGAEIAECTGALSPARQATCPSLDLPAREQWVRAAWQEAAPRLLIFDNLDDDNAVRLLDDYRPKTGGCRLLVTSRRETWPAALGAAIRHLRTLPRPDSIALLQELIDPDAPPAADDVLEAIAKELGDLPLALHLAGSYLRHYRRTVTPTAYLERLADPALLAHPSLTGDKADYSPTGHDLNVASTFALSYERLDAADPVDGLALALLARLAYFSPAQAVPLVLLIPSLRSGAFAGTALDDPAVDDALRRLRALGLLEWEADETGTGAGVLVHRLIAAFVRGRPVEGEPKADVEQAVYDQAQRLNKAGYPGELLPWQSHLRHITDDAISRDSDKVADLSNELGYHLWSVGDYTGARPYYKRALAIYEKTLGPDHPNTALSLNNLGALLRAMGDLAGARPFYERALAIREKVLGPNHPDIATSLNSLGRLLQAMGDLTRARSYYERALAIREKALGPDHPFTATSLNNLGFLLQTLGDLTGARPYYEHALAIREKALGPDHPDTAQSFNNLGTLLQAMGELAAARQYYEQALAIFEAKLGPEHPTTKIVRGNLQSLE